MNRLLIVFAILFAIMFRALPPAFSEIPLQEANGFKLIPAMAEEELREQVVSDNSNASILSGRRFFSLVMDSGCSPDQSAQIERVLLKEKSEIEKKDLGLKFESGYRVGTDDVDGDSWYGFAGLSWELLDNGLYENSRMAKRYLYESAVSEQKATMDHGKDMYFCRAEVIHRYFASLKHSLLTRFLSIQKEEYHRIRTQYFTGTVSPEDLLKAELDLTRTKMLIKKYEYASVDPAPDGLDGHEIPSFFILDMETILRKANESNNIQKTVEIAEKILDEKYDYFADKRLRLYARTGIGKEDGEQESESYTLGIYFSTPIFRKTRDLYPLEIKRSRHRLLKENEKFQTEIQQLGILYSDILSDAVTMKYRLRTNTEKLRKVLLASDEITRNKSWVDPATKETVSSRLVELFKTKYEYLSVLERLYERLLDLFTKTGVTWDEKYALQRLDGAENLRGRKGTRAVYIWNKSFQQYDNRFLIQVLIAKRISYAVISASDRTDLQKLSDFITNARAYNISTRLMLSENSWVKPDKQNRVSEKLKQVLSYSNNIHLDIEPHVFDDYKTNRDIYDEQLTDLVKMVRQIVTADGHLSVSLPVSHTSKTIEAINGHADRIYIMAYGSAKPETIGRRINKFLSIPREKLVLAIRPDDFSSELELEQFIDRMSEKYGILNFAFHDLAQFFRLTGAFH